MYALCITSIARIYSDPFLHRHLLECRGSFTYTRRNVRGASGEQHIEMIRVLTLLPDSCQRTREVRLAAAQNGVLLLDSRAS